MSDYRYPYIPLVSSNRRWRSLPIWICATALAVLLVVANVLVIKRLYLQLYFTSEAQHSLHYDNATRIAIPSPDERAVVTTLYTESYTGGVLTLAQSLKAVNTSARLVLLYFPERISSWTQCRLRSVGWELYPIPRIPPPDGGRGVFYRFLDQYSKLQIWGLDKIGIKSYTLVRRNFDELWALPFTFAAVPDIYGDNRGFTLSFNAGVMFLRTSSEALADMLDKICTAAYKHKDAEQGFLNTYFAVHVVRLPYIYNANLALKRRNADIWHAIEKDMRIVHYTLVKPFYEDERKRLDGGLWMDEMGWWEASWRELIEVQDDQC
ncbi:nucleotide-diphospho-sugar transferase [Phellopilus nigrolimitatus]|nr:nucleotide-diphospho-sugar transferase [Phellopilus nigrolimitatus]